MNNPWPSNPNSIRATQPVPVIHEPERTLADYFRLYVWPFLGPFLAACVFTAAFYVLPALSCR
jgi:hypothetical protein